MNLDAFTILGPDRFLASAHRSAGERAASRGVLESRDAGRSWRYLSLRGQEVHYLRAEEGHVLAFIPENDAEGVEQEMLISRDGGRTWPVSEHGNPFLDVVPDPAKPDYRLVASGLGGTWSSPDLGASWRPISNPHGFLAWPTKDHLYVADIGGVMRKSTDGRRWRDVGRVGGQPVALRATGRDDLNVLLVDGLVGSSDDGGATWSLR